MSTSTNANATNLGDLTQLLTFTEWGKSGFERHKGSASVPRHASGKSLMPSERVGRPMADFLERAALVHSRNMARYKSVKAAQAKAAQAAIDAQRAAA